MATAASQKGGYGRPLSSYLLSSWVVVPLAIIVGAFLGFQFFHLTPRYVKLAFAVLFFLAATRLPFHLAMSMFLVIWPAPTFVFIGDTNVIFLGLMSVVWYLRMKTGRLPRRVSTPIDWAILIYLGLHVVSFVNIDSPNIFYGSLQNMEFMIAGVILYFLIVQAIRTERHLSLALNALCWTAVLADVTAIAEYYFGVRLVPVWFLFSPAVSRDWATPRAQGVFGFHGLLADFSAMNFYVQLLLALRAKTKKGKFVYYLLAATSVLMIVDSANRGGTVILLLGGIYFLWLYRHQVRWSRLLLTLPVLFAAVSSMVVISPRLLNRITLVTRFAQTQLVRGIPENRVGVWGMVLRRIPEHLFLGHGPYIEFRRGAVGEFYWPHNAYLFYLYSTGVAGLCSFLWILGKVIIKTYPRGGVDFARGSLARATQAVFHLQLILFSLAQLRDEHQRGNVYIYYMWILFGLAVVGLRLAKEQARQAAEERKRAGAEGMGAAAVTHSSI
jgi:hypothetical protein